MRNNLWVEKYRPANTDGYVFTNPKLKAQVDEWINNKTIPNLFFTGGAGTGKSTLARILIKELGVQDADVMYANGSKEGRKIEWVDRVISFCQTMAFGDFKIIFIDEADYLNPQSVQPSLRNLIEDYSGSVRFIMTGNYPQRIIKPLQSRFQVFKIDKSDIVDYTSRVATVLISENIEFDLDTLDTYVKAAYPDLRKCINELQQNCIDGKLTIPESTENSSDYRIAMVDLFKQGKISEARKLICSQAPVEEYEEIYKWLYNNLEIFGDEENQDKAILIIKQGLVDHTICCDPEINFSATCVRLSQLGGQKQ